VNGEDDLSEFVVIFPDGELWAHDRTQFVPPPDYSCN
jgi:hypothetical protein